MYDERASEHHWTKCDRNVRSERMWASVSELLNSPFDNPRTVSLRSRMNCSLADGTQISNDTPIRDYSDLQSVAFPARIQFVNPLRHLCSVRQRWAIILRRTHHHSSQWKRKTYSFLLKIREDTEQNPRASNDMITKPLWCARVTESNENLHSIWAFAHTFIPFFHHCPAPPQTGEFQCQSSPDREVFEVYPYHSKILDHIFQFVTC